MGKPGTARWPVAADTLRGLWWCWCTAWANTRTRYGAVAEQLSTWGFAVRGYDHYGHGESGGRAAG